MSTVVHAVLPKPSGFLRAQRGVSTVALEEHRKKAHGIHYTPPALAGYLAEHVANAIRDQFQGSGSISILDPACGDGELLKALTKAVPSRLRGRLSLVGFDTDAEALARAERMLAEIGVESVRLHCGDFLMAVEPNATGGQMGLDFSSETRRAEGFLGQFQAVISNPPYVRTQVLGSAAARELAARFSLSGRVDLYHAFVKAMTLALCDGGILGLLTSNRFLTVQSGASMREWLLEHFHLVRMVDLGDTKLFNAAVLPAVLLAKKAQGIPAQDCEFIRVYQAPAATSKPARNVGSVLEVLDGSFAGYVHTTAACFHVETGRLQTGTHRSTPWTMSNGGIDSWLATVKSHSAGAFSDVAKICVGIKTTADSVFVRDDWNSLPPRERPEEELLHPLVTHHAAARWHLPAEGNGSKCVLYPYRAECEERVPVDLRNYPRTKAYLEKHRPRLESRSYVIESGREWFEIWVPHQPRDWTRPKIAFPDISEVNRFFLVDPGWIVNGDCYWTRLFPGKEDSWLMLMLAVANSSFALKFYDAVFHNKLYAGRRRFMSQYVSRFPLPTPKRSRDILDLMPSLMAASSRRCAVEVEQLQETMDTLVWRAFGLPKEVAR